MDMTEMRKTVERIKSRKSKRLPIKDKALVVIETLVSDDLCEEIEMRQLQSPLVLTQEETDIVCAKIATIYRLAHSVQETYSCYESHDDWRKELEKTYKVMRRNKVL